MTGPDTTPLSQLAGKHIVVLNWRDIQHSQAGGAEQYMHEISKRWVNAGVHVTWLSGQDAHQSAEDTIDGVHIIRGGGTFTVYPIAALRLLKARRKVDAVVDCQNGIPFFSPLFLAKQTPAVQLVHHVHQEQFRTRFSPLVAAVGRHLEGSVARSIYGSRAIAAVSPSTRMELRKLQFQGPIHIVPNGTIAVPEAIGPRDPEPTITIVSRLVPHKRIDVLLGQIATAAAEFPNLRVEIVGDGPERARLEQIALDLGMPSVFTFHGYQPNQVRDDLLNRAWLTMSASDAEGWGCSVVEAAAWGVPCLGLRVPGIRDSIVDGTTGWLVDSPKELGPALISRLKELTDAQYQQELSAACQEWARCFTWDRTTALLTGVLLDELASRTKPGKQQGKGLRRDISTVARFEVSPDTELAGVLGATDELVRTGWTATAVLKGKDEFEASTLLRKAGVTMAEFHSASRVELLAGPAATADSGVLSTR